MTTSTRVRPFVAALAGAGATTALTLYPSAGADAAVNGEYAAFGEAFVNYTGSTLNGECDVTAGDPDPASSTAHFSHGTKHRSVDLDVTFASSDNPADTVRVKGHVDSSMTLRKKHHDLSSFVLQAGGKISVSHSMAHSNCSASGEVLGGTELGFSEHKKG